MRRALDIPLGAIVIVIVGLLLSAAAALLTAGEYAGGVGLEWDKTTAIADSDPASSGDVSARIIAGKIQSTRLNASGYGLFAVNAGLQLQTTRADDRATASCTIRVPSTSVLGRTPGKRASYPLPSEDLASQDVPAGAIVRFYAKGTDTVAVPLGDSISKFTAAPGVKVEWGRYHQGEQTWKWVLTPTPRHHRTVRLNFATMWRTTERPGAEIRCRAADRGRKVAARTTAGV